MLLAADAQRARKPPRRRGQPARRVAAAVGVILLHLEIAGERVLDRQRRLRLFDVDLGQPRGAPRRVARLGGDDEQSLAMEQDLVERQQRLVGENRRDVVLAGNVGGGQHGDDAGGGAHGGEIEALQPAVRLVGHADGEMQRPLRLADVVDIGRGAADVQPRRIVRMRLVDDRRRRAGFVDRHGSLARARHGRLRCGSAPRRRRRPRSTPSSTDWRRPRRDRRRVARMSVIGAKSSANAVSAAVHEPRSSSFAPTSAASALAARFGVGAMPP